MLVLLMDGTYDIRRSNGYMREVNLHLEVTSSAQLIKRYYTKQITERSRSNKRSNQLLAEDKLLPRAEIFIIALSQEF
jgi:hypothetical protein